MTPLKVHVYPTFEGPDRGDGGIRRVVEAQHRWLPQYGIELTPTAADADVVAVHAGAWPENVRPGTPVVTHCHGLYWDGYKWPKWALQINKDVIRNLRQSDFVTGPSEWVSQALRRGTWHNALSLHHGIEPVDWPAVSDEREPYVLWNKTRVDPICDPEPVNKLAAMAPDVRFVTTFGDDALNVTVTGLKPYDGGIRYVRNAGVYLATSRETFGIGTLEAMAAGVPILGWNWGGQAEFVKHLEHGYLANPGDYNDLLKGLRYCLDEANNVRLGLAARAFVLENYTWQQRMRPYADLYHDLAERAREQERVKVSVIITNYNLGRYLPAALDSVLATTLEGVEVIVVDDASTETPAIPQVVLDKAQEYPQQVKVIRNPKNLYLAESLNVGIGAARGRYILNLDADNMIAPGTLETLSQQLDQHRDLDIAYGKILFVPEGAPEKRFVSDWPPPEADLTQQLIHRNQIPSTSMFRRRVWERVGGYRRRCHTAEDADFWTRALSVGFAGRRVTDAVTLVYRDRGDSMSRTNKDWAWHQWYNYAVNPETRLWAAQQAPESQALIPTHEMPLVSVIVPVGPGHQRLLLDALDSIQNQTFPHWECIVVNDTGDLLPWVPSWAKVLNHFSKEPAGVSSARNAGLETARAPFVLFLDADDYLNTDALKVMYEVMRSNNDSGFVYSDWFRVLPGEPIEIWHTENYDYNTIINKMQGSVVCMYNRLELDAHQVRFDLAYNGTGWEDWDFAIQAVVKAGMCGTRIEAPLFHYRMTTGALREHAAANKLAMHAAIQTKWDAYKRGEKPNMAARNGCGCGSRSFASYNGGIDAPTTQADPSQGETVLLQFSGEASMSFLGRVTGNRYKFGTDGDHRVRRVFSQDVSFLLGLGLFKQVSATQVAEVNQEPLLAVGPPQR